MNTHQPLRMPALFVGHGSPMNALEDNAYTRCWEQLGASLPRPKAILAISAHWLTRGVAVTATEKPETIHDFGGFPQALFDMRYPAPGDPQLAARVSDLLAPLDVQLDQEWGLDHGTWSVLVKMYPQADIPVLQMSLDMTKPYAFHHELGGRLARLREEGVMLLASGDVVHNLRTMRRAGGAPYEWAVRFNDRVRECLLSGDTLALADYQQWGEDAQLSVPTPEHFLPLLYVAGTRQPDEVLSIPVDGIDAGSISMLTALVSSSSI